MTREATPEETELFRRSMPEALKKLYAEEDAKALAAELEFARREARQREAQLRGGNRKARRAAAAHARKAQRSHS